MKVIYADTISELNVKSIGFHHDHCYHYYRGKISEVPEKYKKYIKEDIGCCLIYKEDEPNI